GKVEAFTGAGIRSNMSGEALYFDSIEVVNCGSANPGAGDADVTFGGLVVGGGSNVQITNSDFLENFGGGIVLGGCNGVSVAQCNCENTKGIQFTTGPFPIPGGTIAAGLIATDIAAPFNLSTKNVTIVDSSFSGTQATLFSLGAFIGSLSGAATFSNVT